MTEEEKQQQLLLADICARLPYGLKVKCGNIVTKEICELVGINAEISSVSIKDIWAKYYLENVASIKPYLRPLDSMTEEEKSVLLLCNAFIEPRSTEYKVNFYNQHHLDYRDLIEKGLAIKALDGMYKI